MILIGIKFPTIFNFYTVVLDKYREKEVCNYKCKEF